MKKRGHVMEKGGHVVREEERKNGGVIFHVSWYVRMIIRTVAR